MLLSSRARRRLYTLCLVPCSLLPGRTLALGVVELASHGLSQQTDVGDDGDHVEALIRAHLCLLAGRAYKMRDQLHIVTTKEHKSLTENSSNLASILGCLADSLDGSLVVGTKTSDTHLQRQVEGTYNGKRQSRSKPESSVQTQNIPISSMSRPSTFAMASTLSTPD